MAKTLSASEVLGNFPYLHHDYCHWLCPLTPSEWWQLCMDPAETRGEAELGLLLLVMFCKIIIIDKCIHLFLFFFFSPIASLLFFFPASHCNKSTYKCTGLFPPGMLEDK